MSKDDKLRKQYYETIRSLKINWDHKDIYPELKDGAGLAKFCSYHGFPKVFDRQFRNLIDSKESKENVILLPDQFESRGFNSPDHNIKGTWMLT